MTGCRFARIFPAAGSPCGKFLLNKRSWSDSGQKPFSLTFAMLLIIHQGKNEWGFIYWEGAARNLIFK
jgi:hypothetical protein